MSSFLLLVGFVVLLVVLLRQANRLEKIESRIVELEAADSTRGEETRRAIKRALAEATPPKFEPQPARPAPTVATEHQPPAVARDRSAPAPAPRPPVSAAPEPAPLPAAPTPVVPALPPAPPATPLPSAEPKPAPASARPGLVAEPTPTLRPAPGVPEPVPALEEPADGIGERLRAAFAGEDWEAIVGGSWTNKIGVAAIVIGVALLLGYYFPRIGPGGRVAMGVGISLTLLATGMWVERRERYMIFARGLIGGGWASLYFTAYAMHGLEASRIVESALVGTLLLAVVATGMIAHSLHYRSQVVTGLAYFLAFVALSLGGAPGFSLVALVPLATSLLIVTRRFSWAPMMLAGLGLTYGTYLAAASGAPSPAFGDFVRAESVLAIYWLLFETFDLIEFARGRISPWTAALSPLNAAAFLGISLLQWTSMTPDTVYLLFGSTGALYAVSAVLRARVRPPSSFGEDSTVMERAAIGGYELAVTISAGLLAWACTQRFEDLRLVLALFMEAELLFMIGRTTGQPYLRLLGTIWMVGPLGLLLNAAQRISGLVATLGLTMPEWVPLSALIAGVFYANRAFLRGRAVLPVERAFNPLATVLVVIVLSQVTSLTWLGVAWFVAALVYFELGSRTQADEFRLHAYVVMALAVISVFKANIPGAPGGAWTIPALISALSYGFAWRQHIGRQRAMDDERLVTRVIVSIPASLLAGIVCWLVVPDQFLGLAWLLLGLGWYEFAARTAAVDLRLHTYAGAVLGLLWVVGHNVLNADPGRWPIPGAAAIACYALAARHVYGTNRIGSSERRIARMAFTVPGSALVSAVCWMALPDPFFRLSWVTFAIVLFELGANSNWVELKVQGYVVLLAGVVSIALQDVFLAPFPTLEHNLSVGGAMALLAGWYLRLTLRAPSQLTDEGERNLARHIGSAFSLFFMGALIWQTASEPMVAIGWTAAASLALEAGWGLGDASLRGQGHAAMAVAIVRLVAVNFTLLTPDTGLTPRLLTVAAAAAACCYVAIRTRAKAPASPPAELMAARAYLWASMALVAALALVEMPAALVADGWAALGVAAFVVGLWRRDDDLRLHGYILAAASVGRCWMVNLASGHLDPSMPDPVALTALVVALCFVAQLLAPRPGAGPVTTSPLLASLDRHARTGFALLGTTLLTVLLYYKMSAQALTVAWGIEAAVIVVFGFIAHERALRLSGLLLLAICIAKLFALDFRGLDALARIISFIVLGVLLVAASWVYTRYRDQLHKYL